MEQETLFFSKIITKNLQFKNENGRRLFKGYLTVEMVDKQNEITIRDELAKVVPIWINRGGPISDNHSNRIVGRGLEWEKTTLYDEKSNKSYPAIMILGEIFKNYQLDDFIWEAIKRGEYRGLSFGGSTKSNRVPTMQDNGKVAYALKDLEQYEVAVCREPAVPLALIVEHNHLAKSAADEYHVRPDGKAVIRCTNVGCFVEKKGPIYEGRQDNSSSPVVYEGPREKDEQNKNKYQDTFDVYDDKDAINDKPKKSEEWSGTDGVNRPQKDRKVVEDNADQQEAEVTSGNQNDATGNDQTYRGSSKANTQGSYPSTGDSYNTYNARDDEKAIKEKASVEGLQPSKQKPGRVADIDDAVATGTGKVPAERVGTSAGRDLQTGAGIVGHSDLARQNEDAGMSFDPDIARKLKTILDKASMYVEGGTHTCDAYHGDNRSGLKVNQGKRNVETSMDEDEKELPIEKDEPPAGSKQLEDEYEGMLSGKIPQSRLAPSEGPVGIKQVKPENLTSLKGNGEYSMNGIVRDPSEEEKDLKHKGNQAPTGYVDKPKEERESRRNKWVTPSLQAANGEDGPNQPRADDDEKAEGLKKDFTMIGGTKGSYDTFEQGTGQTSQTRSQHGRDEEVREGKESKKDPYNSINTSANKLLINMRAISILKQLS